jgi:hypothetical protein
MTDTGRIYSETLAQLNDTFLKMVSPEWDLRMMTATLEEKAAANRQLSDVQKARLRLGNAVLAEITGALAANEDALITGRKNLRDALQDLQNLQKTLNHIAGFVNVVGRVVSLA